METSEIIQPNLGLAYKSDSDIFAYAVDKTTKVPVVFPDTTPPIADVSDAADVFQSKILKAIHGTPADTAAKRLARAELCVLLTLLAYDCIRQSEGNLPKFLSTGFAAKRKPSPVGILPAPQNVRLLANANERQLITRFDKIKGSHSYLVYMGEDPSTPETWTLAGSTSGTRLTINNLDSGKKYYARVRAIGARQTLGNWSDISTKVCP